MDELRKELRSLFERRQADLGEIRGSRETLMKRALARKDEPLGGRLNFAVGIAAVLIAALVIATFAYVRGRGIGHEGPSPGASSSRVAIPVTVKPPSIPHGVAVLDLDLVDLSTGWVLFTTCVQPMTGTCRYSVGATADGGGTWSKPVQVGGQFDPENGDAPRAIHFLNKSDGFVYGGSIAFVTHDGGRTWARLNIAYVFVSFIAGRGSVAWAATYPCTKGTVCSYEIRSSVDGGRTWSKPYKLPAGLSPVEGVPFGASGLLLATATDLMITLDTGATWREIRSTCTSAVFSERIATSDGRELWLLCGEFPTGSGDVRKTLWVSEDAGATWKQRATSQPGTLVEPGSAADFISPSAGSAMYHAGRPGVMVSHDAGRSWKQAGPSDTAFVAIRFCSATDGWALDNQNYIWATMDGGDHWIQVSGIRIASS